MRAGTNLVGVGQYNSKVVIHALRRLGPSSQTDLAAATGLSAQTVSQIVRNLVAEGMLTEVRTEVAGRGRPKVIMDIVGSSRFALGVHVDPSLMTAVLLDLNGTVIDSARTQDVDIDNPEVTLRQASEAAKAMLGPAGTRHSRLVGACLATPGTLDPVIHSMVKSQWLPGWAGAPVGQILGRELGIPVTVVKDTLAAVIGENWVRAGQSLDATMIFVYVGMGTGLGLSIYGEPVRGFSGNAGEVGTILLTLGANTPGAEGGLDNDPALMVEHAFKQGVLDGVMPERTDLRAVDRQFKNLAAQASAGVPGALGLLEGSASRVAELALMTIELLDADMVVFGGPYWDVVAEWYAPAVLRALGRPSARGPHPVSVLGTAMGDDVGAIGAAAVVLDDRFVPRAPQWMQNSKG